MAATRKITPLILLLISSVIAATTDELRRNDSVETVNMTKNQYYSECKTVELGDFAYTTIIFDIDENDDKNSSNYKFNLLQNNRQFYKRGPSCGALWLKRGEQYSFGNFTEKQEVEYDDQANNQTEINKNSTAKRHHDIHRNNNSSNSTTQNNKTNNQTENKNQTITEEIGIKIPEKQQFVQMKNRLDKAEINKMQSQQNQPFWQVDFTSDVGFTLPANIDPEFPYLQLGPEEFEALFDYFFTVYGFFPEYESSHKYDSDEQDDMGILKFTTNQTCRNIYGCFQGFDFQLSGDNGLEGINQNNQEANKLNFQFDPKDYLIDIGNNQCTIGITTCSNKNADCPIVLGKLALNQFDALLDYDQNSVWMRQEPQYSKMKQRRQKKENDICQSTSASDDTRPKGMIDKALDLYIKIDRGMSYISQPKNFYYELIGHPHAWVLNSELIIVVGSILVTFGSLFLSVMSALIYLSYLMVEKFATQ